MQMPQVAEVKYSTNATRSAAPATPTVSKDTQVSATNDFFKTPLHKKRLLSKNRTHSIIIARASFAVSIVESERGGSCTEPEISHQAGIVSHPGKGSTWIR